MGAFLDKPITAKETHSEANAELQLEVAVSAMQGWRIDMEVCLSSSGRLHLKRLQRNVPSIRLAFFSQPPRSHCRATSLQRRFGRSVFPCNARPGTAGWAPRRVALLYCWASSVCAGELRALHHLRSDEILGVSNCTLQHINRCRAFSGRRFFLYLQPPHAGWPFPCNLTDSTSAWRPLSWLAMRSPRNHFSRRSPRNHFFSVLRGPFVSSSPPRFPPIAVAALSTR